MLIVNGITYTDDASKAEVINEYFASQSSNTTSDVDENELK